ncbi:MAG: hypothetical protein ABFD07_10960 [Methanobacterium sp.]
MNIVTIVEIIATILTIYGVIVIAIPKRYGLWILTIAAVAWGAFGYMTDAIFLLIQNVFLGIVDLVALYNWKKKGIGE